MRASILTLALSLTIIPTTLQAQSGPNNYPTWVETFYQVTPDPAFFGWSSGRSSTNPTPTTATLIGQVGDLIVTSFTRPWHFRVTGFATDNPAFRMLFSALCDNAGTYEYTCPVQLEGSVVQVFVEWYVDDRLGRNDVELRLFGNRLDGGSRTLDQAAVMDARATAVVIMP